MPILFLYQSSQQHHKTNQYYRTIVNSLSTVCSSVVLRTMICWADGSKSASTSSVRATGCRPQGRAGGFNIQLLVDKVNAPVSQVFDFIVWLPGDRVNAPVGTVDLTR